MKVEDFIRKYNKASDKEKFIENRICVKYVPYEDKIEFCRQIILATHYNIVNDTRVFEKNSAFAFPLFACGLITNYTDIDIETEETLVDFNQLDREGLIDKLLSAIPKSEMERFQTVNQMVLDDEYENNRSIIGLLDGFLSSIELFGNSLGVEENGEQKELGEGS